MDVFSELPATWQDWVLTVGQVIFFLALLPSIFSTDKPSVWTSLITALILTSFVMVFWSLSLAYGAITSALVAVAWYILFFQKIFSKRKRP